MRFVVYIICCNSFFVSLYVSGTDILVQVPPIGVKVVIQTELLPFR